MSSVDDWERFTSLGGKLGYTGPELRKWVTEQIKAAEEKAKLEHEREVRRLERESKQKETAERAKLELEARQAQQLKWEQEKFAKEEELKRLEVEQKQHEVESKERIRMSELELERERLDKKKTNDAVDDADGDDDNDAGSDDSSSSSTRRRARAGPKLPYFDEKDNIDSYLRRFERYAELQGWPRAEWAIYLSALLKGKALEVYSRLAEKEAKSYDKLKSALLRKYDLTVEGFRKKFHEARRERDETAAQFICRLVGYLDRWVQLANIQETYEGLKDLFVKEQFLAVSEEELTLYIRERAPKTLEELVNLADLYLEARSKPSKSVGKEFRKKDPLYRKSYPVKAESAENPPQAKTSSDLRPRAESKEERVCYTCGQSGHVRRFCPQRRSDGRRGNGGRVDMVASCQVVHDENKISCQHQTSSNGMLKLECGCELPYVGCLTVRPGVRTGGKKLCVESGKANGKGATVLRDTGCTTVVIRRGLVHGNQLTGKYKYYRMLDGTIGKAEVAVVDIETPYVSGRLPCLCVESPTCDIIVGNVDVPVEPTAVDEANAVTTRAKALAEAKPPRRLVVPTFHDLQVSVSDMQRLQRECDDLQKWFDYAKTGQVNRSGKAASVKFVVRNGLLYRIYQTEHGSETKQLVVPVSLRKGVLNLAHESIMSGHLGSKKTLDRVLSQFAWPGVAGDIARHCRSCDTCQRTVHKGRVAKAPLQKMPIISVPFQKVGIDLIGPITPASSSACRFVLTLVDYATRYPEAVALRGISTQEVAEALCKIFSRVGIPSQVVSDQGTQFVSDVMQEVYRLLSIEHLKTTPYHPQCNGLVERFNGTLKSMLRKLCTERPSDWDRYLEAVLFAYREVKQESLGFSPFELLYGRTVRGPMAILREVWSKDIPDEEKQSTYQYVFELRNRLEETCKLVEESLKHSQMKAKAHFDRKARSRDLKAGDKVLILLPTDSHKLLMQWKGPFEVIDKVGIADYRIQLKSGSKVFHINMLKQYFPRDSRTTGDTKPRTCPDDDCEGDCDDVSAAILEENDCDQEELEVNVPSSTAANRETVSDVHICPDLSQNQKEELCQLLEEFRDIFSDLPGATKLAEHKIQLTDNNPVRSKQYPIPHTLRDVVKSEVDEMCRMGVIERSESPYSSPLLLVKKKDGSNRPVVDFRQVNKVTVFDAEPMPKTEDIYAKLAKARYFSTLDFCKGYWQIPMANEDREKTAFSTPFGLFHFVRMPFGLQNAGATYSRLMRRVLDGLELTDNFVDDVVSYTETWRRHLQELRSLFERVRSAELKVKPSKCYFGYAEVEFLGHVVGKGCVRTMLEKTEKIYKAPVPRTKKQLRSFLGLAGYYRQFVPNYSTIAAPLTDMTGRGTPNNVVWGETQEKAFRALKERLCSEPVLRLPDQDKPYILRTDASDVGLGAILFQEHPDGVFPVAYLSKKLSRAERNYSVVERECLAVVWAVSKLYCYLYGKAFVLQTDHRPLTFLDKAKMTNARVMRWALSLQPFHYRVESIKGTENVGADYLNRAPSDECISKAPHN